MYSRVRQTWDKQWIWELVSNNERTMCVSTHTYSTAKKARQSLKRLVSAKRTSYLCQEVDMFGKEQNICWV